MECNEVAERLARIAAETGEELIAVIAGEVDQVAPRKAMINSWLAELAQRMTPREVADVRELVTQCINLE